MRYVQVPAAAALFLLLLLLRAEHFFWHSLKKCHLILLVKSSCIYLNFKKNPPQFSSISHSTPNQPRRAANSVHGSALNRSSSASSGGTDNCMDESAQKMLRLLWRKLRTSDEDGALNAICSLLQHGCGWANDCSGDGSALLHAVSRPLS